MIFKVIMVIGLILFIFLFLIISHMIVMGRGIMRIEKNALNLALASGEDPTQFLQTGRKLRFVTPLLFSGAYTISRQSDGHFEHHVSFKQLLPIPSVFRTSFLLCFGILSKQLNDAGVDINTEDNPFFQITDVDTGTRHVTFQLSKKEHAAFEAFVNDAKKPDASSKD